MSESSIGFIGAGKMATALAKGFLNAGQVSANQLFASDPFPVALESFQEETQAQTVSSNVELTQKASTIFLAVKPQLMQEATQELAAVLTEEHLVVSIAAGIPLARLSTLLGSKVRLIRVMPNTPCLVGAGASAFSLGQNATQQDSDFVQQLLSCVGCAIPVKEPLLDAVTGLSGSGPAFVYVIIEALSDAGVLKGLPRDTALTLAAQTVMGAAQMVLTTGKHTGTLKDDVTSPGGTTIAGIAALEQAGLRSALIQAVDAATERCIELGK